MYRRIEVIKNYSQKQIQQWIQAAKLFGHDGAVEVYNGEKGGLFTGPLCSIDVNETWWNKCLGPGSSGKGNIPSNKNCRFFFTETGWKECGKFAAAKLKEFGIEFRVVTIKEKSVDVVWRAKHEVAVRPRRKQCKSA